MGLVITKNMAFGELASDIGDTDLVASVRSGQGARFDTAGASDFCWGILVDYNESIYDRFEVVLLGQRSTDTFTIIARAQLGTTAKAFPITPGNPAANVKLAVGWNVANLMGMVDGGGAVIQAAAPTLTNVSPRNLLLSPTGGDITLALPTTYVWAFKEFFIVNHGTSLITVQASGGSTVCVVQPNGAVTVKALQDTPTSASHWLVQEGGGPQATTLSDADATISRTPARSLYQTPTATRTLTLDNSFRAGDRLRFVNKATGKWMQLVADDASALGPVLPGMYVEVECISDNPADSTGWKIGRPQGENAANYVDVTGTSGADNTAQFVKQITIPAYLLDSMQEVLVICEFEPSGTTTWRLYLGTAGTTSDSKIIDITASVTKWGLTARLKKVDSTHVAYACHAGSSAGPEGSAGVSTTNIDTTADMIVGVWQDVTVGVHITVKELMLAL
jgi:hypothetical protein